jgi:predicted glycoside hydrolase/deacetylase ChbG (UPF0249 family)
MTAKERAKHSGRRCLVVNGDDFGLCRAVDEGILHAHRSGILTSTSLFVTFPDRLSESVMLLKQCSSLSPGLHLDLTWGPGAWCGNAGADKRRAAPVGNAARLTRLMVCGRVRRRAIVCALRRQFEEYIRTGLPLTHVDCHQHVHALPGLHSAVHSLCREFCAPFLRVPQEAAWGMRKPAVKRILLRAFAVTRRAGSPVQSVGILGPGRWTVEGLTMVVRKMPPGVTEIVTHPGSEGVVLGLDRLGRGRQDELMTLCDPRVARCIREEDVALVSFADIAKQARSFHVAAI